MRRSVSRPLEAADAAHPHVHQDQVGLEFGDEPQSLLAAGSGSQLDLRRIKNPLERVLDIGFVIDQQQFAHVRALFNRGGAYHSRPGGIGNFLSYEL
jgi:hypothetical protein